MPSPSKTTMKPLYTLTPNMALKKDLETLKFYTTRLNILSNTELTRRLEPSKFQSRPLVNILRPSIDQRKNKDTPKNTQSRTETTTTFATPLSQEYPTVITSRLSTEMFHLPPMKLTTRFSTEKKKSTDTETRSRSSRDLTPSLSTEMSQRFVTPTSTPFSTERRLRPDTTPSSMRT